MLQGHLNFIISNGLARSRACLFLCFIILICGVFLIVDKKANATVGRSFDLIQPVQQPTPPPTIIKVTSRACWKDVSNQGCDQKESTNSGHQAQVNVDGGARTSSVIITGDEESLQANLSSKIDYDLIGGPGAWREANNNLEIAIYVLDHPTNIYTINVSQLSRSLAVSVVQANDGWRFIGCPCNSAYAEATSTDLTQPFVKTGNASSFNSSTVNLPEYPGFTYRLAYSDSFQTRVLGTVSNWDYNADIYALSELALSISARKEVQELITVEFAEALESNPNAGGGLRLFPDRAEPDSEVRNKVKIRALGPPNTDIYFKSFDVDDPSSDDAPVDENGSLGNDNRGLPQSGILKSEDGLNGTDLSGIISIKSDDAGYAFLDFTVTMNPGDNFVIAASLDRDYLSNITVNGTDLIDNSGQTLPTQQGKKTEMLTIWRRVNIELATMKPVSGNYLTGQIINAKKTLCPNGYRQCLKINAKPIPDTLGLQQSDPWSDLERFIYYPSDLTGSSKGAIKIIGLEGNSSLNNGHYASWIEPKNNGAPGDIIVEYDYPDSQLKDLLGKWFFLYDDDDFNNNNSLKTGDDGESLSIPDISLIQDSDDPLENVFAPAYIRPKYDLPYNTNVAFRLNVDTDQSMIDATFLSEMNIKTIHGNSEYWTRYILSAYQPETRENKKGKKVVISAGDYDPNSQALEAPILGASGFIGVCVFLETIRDRKQDADIRTMNAIVAHEIGHTFGGEHEDGWLMAQGNNQITSFHPITIDKIRRTIASPRQ